MSTDQSRHQASVVDELYAETEHWVLNTGEQTIHAKRMGGKWRVVKWLAASVWLIFFLGPYLRWDGRQAILFDIPNRQFHIFGATVLPQDFWMLSLLLLFFAILLAVVTALAGRVWCGYFCFQTVWTDVFTWIEEKLEGPPQKRRKLDTAPLDAHKLGVKTAKHALWLLVSAITGVSFVAWFTDGYRLWVDLLGFNGHPVAYMTIGLFTAGTYGLAGFLREQTCLWLCPYARIQSVMVDSTTVIPSYDFARGEPRGKVRKGQSKSERATGDCVDCKQCVAVCPTGVDIREGMQEGCIMCAMCIDACDAVMDKLDRPRGLIRYDSLDALQGKPSRPLLKRPRVWVYSAILLFSALGLVYGLSSLDAVDLKVIHERQPLFVLQSDGSIQNKYTLKILNKTPGDVDLQISANGPEGILLQGVDRGFRASAGKVSAKTVFVRVPQHNLQSGSEPIVFQIETIGLPEVYQSRRESVFMGPES